jgi:TetR/AcrR family transcriptional repressor of nem operon
MRLTKEQSAENRRRILDAAARLFREQGFDAVGVADLMKAAGFTHGGFYNHFPSKEALAAEASSAAIARSNAALAERLKRPRRKKKDAAFRRYVDGYLSREHRDDPASGCPIAALAADAARQGREVQESFAAGIANLIDLLAAHLAETGAGGTARRWAVQQLSEMVGALVLSRAIAKADQALSAEILENHNMQRRGCALRE